MRHDPVSVLQTTATNASAANVGQAAQTYADASAAWVDAESHAYAAYEQDLAAAHVALVSAIAPANVTYAQDAAQAWADYHVSMTGIQEDMDTAWAQVNVAQANAADPATFAYIYPQYGGSWAPMMPGGVSALSWAYFEASSFISTLGMPEYTPPPNPPANPDPGPSARGSPPASSGFWHSVGDFLYWDIGATLYYLPSAYIETGVNGTQAQSLAAWADGFVPFVDPFAKFGAYSSEENPMFAWSQFAGGISRDALLAAVIPNLGSWSQNPVMYELGSTTIPGRLFSSLSHLTPIERGEAIFRQLGCGGLRLSRYASRTDWALTLPSLGTPGAWLSLIVGAHLLDWLYGE